MGKRIKEKPIHDISDPAFENFLQNTARIADQCTMPDVRIDTDIRVSAASLLGKGVHYVTELAASTIDEHSTINPKCFVIDSGKVGYRGIITDKYSLEIRVERISDSDVFDVKIRIIGVSRID